MASLEALQDGEIQRLGRDRRYDVSMARSDLEKAAAEMDAFETVVPPETELGDAPKFVPDTTAEQPIRLATQAEIDSFTAARLRQEIKAIHEQAQWN